MRQHAVQKDAAGHLQPGAGLLFEDADDHRVRGQRGRLAQPAGSRQRQLPLPGQEHGAACREGVLEHFVQRRRSHFLEPELLD